MARVRRHRLRAWSAAVIRADGTIGKNSPSPGKVFGATHVLHPERLERWRLMPGCRRCGMAERVGFVPDEPATLNDLGAIGTARNRQIH